MAHRLPDPRRPLPPLRVLPRGLATVQDYAALMDPRAGINRFHGWRFDGTLGPEFVDPVDGQTKRHGGRVKLVDEVVTIAPGDPHRAEYIKHLKAGDLWAADAATAQEAGVPFEPHFLGEHPLTSKAHGVNPLDDHTARAMVEAGGLSGLPWDTEFKPAPPALAIDPKPSAPSSSAAASK